jgi:hypothetical protein
MNGKVYVPPVAAEAGQVATETLGTFIARKLPIPLVQEASSLIDDFGLGANRFDPHSRQHIRSADRGGKCTR